MSHKYKHMHSLESTGIVAFLIKMDRETFESMAPRTPVSTRESVRTLPFTHAQKSHDSISRTVLKREMAGEA